MDTPCHALTGFVIGHAVQSDGEEVDRPGPLFATLTSLLPDADFFLRWFGMSAYLTYHRAVLNSVFLLPPILLLFAGSYGWYRRRAPLRSYLWVALLVGMVHVFMDLLNTFGSPIFFPLSFGRYAFDLMFIVDLFVYGFLFIPCVARLIQGRWSPRLARWAFVLIGGYILFSGINQHLARNQLDQFRAEREISPSTIRNQGVTPQPLLPVHWSLILQHDDGSQQVFVNTLTGRRYAADDQFEHDQRAFDLLKEGARYDQDARVFRWFARYPVVLRETDRDIIYGDLQFNVKVYPSVRNTLLGSERNRSLPFRFRCREKKDPRPSFEWVGENGE